MKKNINNIVIEVKRWFDKINGNTYHSVNVYVNGEFIGRVPFAYGYDRQYLQTAHTMLQEVGIYPITGKMLSSGANKDYYEVYPVTGLAGATGNAGGALVGRHWPIW